MSFISGFSNEIRKLAQVKKKVEEVKQIGKNFVGDIKNLGYGGTPHHTQQARTIRKEAPFYGSLIGAFSPIPGIQAIPGSLIGKKVGEKLGDKWANKITKDPAGYYKRMKLGKARIRKARDFLKKKFYGR